MTRTDGNGNGGSIDDRARARPSGRDRTRAVPDDGAGTAASRRDVLRAIGVGSLATAGVASVVSAQQSPEGPIVVADFDGDPAWPGTNDLGEWASAGELANGSGEVVDGALRLEYEDTGWFAANVRRDVSATDRLEFVIRGDDGGEGEDVTLEVGGVEGSFADLADGEVTTSFSTVGVDLAAAGVDRSSVDDVWLEFFGDGSGAIEIDEIRFVAATETGGPPALPGHENAPTDPDGDGQYEDLTGNGGTDPADVVQLFEHKNDPEVADYPEYYDFSGNGGIEVADVVQLFQEL